MPVLTVVVSDIDTNVGVPNAGVYLFKNGGSIEPPENADHVEYTNENGSAFFEVEGFFRVGIIAYGYESAYSPHTPIEEWKDTWTCWGAIGVGRDMEYLFSVRNIVCVEHPQLLALYQRAQSRGLTRVADRIAGICQRIEKPETETERRFKANVSVEM